MPIASLPLPIAKAMKPLTGEPGRFGFVQILCEANGEHARYVVTNGQVMLIVDTTRPAPTESQVFSGEKRTDPDTGKPGPSDIDLVVASKGHYPAECVYAEGRGFPDYKQITGVDEIVRQEPVTSFCFNVKYMDQMLKIHKALRLPSSYSFWTLSVTDGAMGPTVWEPSVGEADMAEVELTRVQFIVMPAREPG